MLRSRSPYDRSRRIRWIAAALVALAVSVPSVLSGDLRVPPGAPSGVHPGPRMTPAVVRATGIQGPVDGRLVNTSLSALSGVASSNTLALDPTGQRAYSLNRDSGNLVEFNLTSGQPIASTQLVNPAKFSPYGLALDAATHQVFVSVPSTGPVRPWVLALNASTLALQSNISSFASARGFDPASLLVDPDSGQVFIENRTTLDTTILDPASDSVTGVLPAAGCVGCSPHGMIALPGRHTILLSSGTATLPTINSTTDLVGVPFVAPFPQFGSSVAAVDNRSAEVWIANASGSGDIEVFTTGGSYVGVVVGPPAPTAIAYLWRGDIVAVADSNASYPGTGWEVYTFSGSARLEVGHYTNPGVPRWESGYAFSGLYADVTPAGPYLVTSGDGNASVEFALNVSTGALRLAQSYSSFPDQRLAVISDPANGRFYGIDGSPAGITGYDSATGLALWHVDLTYPAATYSLPSVASDPSQQRLFVSYQAAFIDAYSSATGAYESTLFLGSAVDSLSVDVVHRLLYAGDLAAAGDNVSVINLAATPITVLSTFNTSESVCSVAAISALAEVAVGACNDTGTTFVRLYSGFNDSLLGSFRATASASHSIRVDSASQIYVASTISGNVTVYDAASRHYGSNWTLGPVAQPSGVGLDAVDGLAVATSRSLPEVKLINLTTGQVSYKISIPSPALGSPDFDFTTSTFLVPLGFTGQTLSIALVPLPATPPGFSATPGNRSVTAQWEPSAGTPGFPVRSYLLLDAATAAGPWAVANSTLNLSATVEGLVNGVAYFFTVVASSAAGTSPMAPVANVTPVGVPYPPTNVAIVNVTADSLEVTWGPPDFTQGASVSNYTVFYATSLAGPWLGVSAGSGGRVELGGLFSSTTYFVRVVAWNLAGPSNPSSTANGMTGPASGARASSTGLNGLWAAVVLLALVAVAIASTLLLVGVQRRASRGRAVVLRTTGPPRGVHAETGEAGPSPARTPQDPIDRE